MARICTIAAANKWLFDSVIADYNPQSAVAAEQEGLTFVIDAVAELLDEFQRAGLAPGILA